jgi:Unconventional myosin tail, actin- and lipid-binding
LIKQFSNPDEPVLFHCSITKLSRFNFKLSRTLIVTTGHIYVFEDSKINRKHKITNIGAIINSTKSTEMVLVFPMAKDLRLNGLERRDDLQKIIQLRFINRDPVNTLKIFAVPQSSLHQFASVTSKYVINNLPDE